MQLLKFNNINDFLNNAEKTLLQDEAANNLILGTCYRLQKQEISTDSSAFLSIILDNEDNFLLIGVITPPRNLMIHVNSDRELDSALDLLSKDLIQFDPNLPGILARPEVARQFAEIWANMTGKPFQVQFEQRVFELRKVNHPEISEGALKLATPEDLELATEWNYEFVREALFKSDLENAQKSALRKINNEELYWWMVDDPVSMVAKARPTKNMIAVNSVYTPPKYRKRGYASASVAALSQKLLDSGYKSCVLFTDLANPTSNKIYQNIGYKPVCDYTSYEFRNLV